MRQKIIVTSALLVLMSCSEQPEHEGNQVATSVAARVELNQTSPAKSSVPEPSAGKMPMRKAAVVKPTPPSTPIGTEPSYDIEAYCRNVSASVGGSYVIEKGCRDQEQSALDSIRSRNVPERVSRYCDEVARSIGGSYVIFRGCVDQELGAAAEL